MSDDTPAHVRSLTDDDRKDAREWGAREFEAAYRKAKAEAYDLSVENDALRHGMVSLVTRLNVIDHRHDSIGDDDDKRLTFEVRNVTVDLSIQDEGRTLKVFFRDPL